MVKAVATGRDGRAILVMGISQGNVDRLKQGEPIYFDPAALRIAHGTEIAGITLFYGATDADLTRTLRTFISQKTEVITIPRGDTRPQ